MEETKSCKDCENLIFDETWGEVKCKHYKHKIYYPEVYAEDCPNYKKKKESEKNGKPSRRVPR